ncbi:hypothetical protein BHE97_07525 [Aeromicrobium sp. PE09-221]|uniref:ABC transporter ATP-binding protein n=1 Tax=Aeromicrobium sp. PE09-221 TaxID=1898043 RepID=UPI000B3EB568|nr:ABC transporter ATP-binding protein [Aeromicrobium sp. PE09-221]OUZ10421.1 hypothetical protein BHE97_07525 [Aeromicrobium sp. PE09-221]
MSQSAPRLSMRGIVKEFGPVRALDRAELEVAPREIHGLLGGNGAGKTTLMNVLYGLYRADAGTIAIDGAEVVIASPKDAIDAGVGMVHQSFLQIDSYTVTENIVLGTKLPGPAWRLDLSDPREQVAELSSRFGLHVDPEAIVEDLPVGVRQRVEILKALYRGVGTLILDEPTTNLTPGEVDELFRSMRTMVDEGLSVILITHKIRETMAACDRMTVMRDGRRIATVRREETDAEALAAIMVGRDIDEGVPEAAVIATGVVEDLENVADVVESAEPLRPDPVDSGAVRIEDLRVRNDHGVEAVRGLSLSMSRGEILGVAGVAGNGQVEFAEAVAGVRQPESGRVSIRGTDLVGRPTREWLAAKVAYVPEDRDGDGVLPTMTVAENLVLGSQRSADIRRGGLIDWKAARQKAAEAIATYSIRANGPNALAGDLSGGNIQRVILARAFAHEPSLLILHNPTRGLDLRSTQFVYEQVHAATAAGCSVLLLSEDLDELVALSDRLVTIYNGEFVGEWARGAVDQVAVGQSMAGVGVER